MAAIGAVLPHSARVWIRSVEAGDVRVECQAADDSHSFVGLAGSAPDNASDNTCVVELTGLEPLADYRFRALRERDGHVLGEGRFQTAPGSVAETPARFAIALMSCHQPFDGDGCLDEPSLEMLRAVQKCLRQNRAGIVLMAGDQMYSDQPPRLSLFNEDYFPRVAPPGRERLVDCTAEEVRRLYQARYRHFWNIPEWRAIQAEFPCFHIWDDHDIIDNWGSDPKHRQPPWLTVGEGARRACHDYQMSRVLPAGEMPASFHYAIVHGAIAIFVMDLRSERREGENDGRLFSDDQEAALDEFLETHRDKPAVFLVLSVPFVHLPRLLTSVMSRISGDGEDFSDRWSADAHIRDRDRIIRKLREHQRRVPRQRIVLLSGDIHIGCAHEIRWQDDDGGSFHQLISSGITHHAGALIAFISKLLMRMKRTIETDDSQLRGKVELMPGAGDFCQNPFGGLNLGLVEIETREEGRAMDLRFSLWGHRGDEPVCQFRSEAITGESPA